MQAVVALIAMKDFRDGKTPSRDEALRLAHAAGADMAASLDTAAAPRDQHKGKTISFSPKISIPLTNLCLDFCSYCTFRKAPGEAGAQTMAIDEVLAVSRRGKL